MKKLALYIVLMFNFMSAKSQTIVIADSGFKACLVNNYPSLVDTNDDLVISAAQSYTGSISCNNMNIQEASILQYLPNISSIGLWDNNLTDLTPLIYLDSVQSIYIGHNDVTLVPNLSSKTKLNWLDLQGNEISVMPSGPSGLTFLNVGQNNLTGTADISPYPFITRFYAYGNSLDSIIGYGTNTGFLELAASGNQLTYVESFTNNINLEELGLGYNLLRRVEGLENKPSLDTILINHNLIDTIIFDTTNGPYISMRNNLITFDDMLALSIWSLYPGNTPQIENQKDWNVNINVNVVNGTGWNYSVPFDKNVASNSYSWYQDSVLLDSGNSNTYSIPITGLQHEGHYHCIVHNINYPNKPITVHGIQLKVVNDFDATEPYAFSPDGDGNADYFEIRDVGQALIYNRRGEMVRKITVPAFWDGTGDGGQILDYGYYIIVVNESKKYGVTLAR